MKITYFSTKNFEKPFIYKVPDYNHHISLVQDHLNDDTVEKAKGSDAIVIFATDDASAEVIERLYNIGIKYIVTRTAGFDHIDLDKARSLGIRVSVVPEYSPNAIAEHAVGLMIALNRKLMVAQNHIHDYNFDLNGLMGFDINNKTVGVIGAGKIGSVTVQILNGFGSDILIYDPVKNKELEQKYGAKYVYFDQLCKKSDIIIIHAPLNESTHHLINKDAFAKMKPGLMIINVARGAIIKTQDLLEALKNGQVGSAGIDVYEFEKGLFFTDQSAKSVLQDSYFNELLSFKNVIITGHQAFLTDTAIKNMIGVPLKNLKEMEEGEKCENEL